MQGGLEDPAHWGAFLSEAVQEQTALEQLIEQAPDDDQPSYVVLRSARAIMSGQLAVIEAIQALHHRLDELVGR
jgi:hypothetical protein